MPDEGRALPPPLVMVLDAHPGRVVLEVRGDVDVRTSPQLRATLEAVVATGPSELVVDVSGVRLLGASGLGVLVRTATLLGSGRLCVSGASPLTRRLFELFTLEEVLGVVPPAGPSGAI